MRADTKRIWQTILIMVFGFIPVLCGYAGAPRPATPGSLSLPGSDTDGSFTFKWGATFGGDRYEIIRTGTSSGSYSTSSTSISIKSLADGVYSFKVRACTENWRAFAEECGYYSTSKTIKVYRTPGTPSSLTVPSKDGDGSYTIKWGSSSGTSLKYRLYERKNSGSWVNVYTGSSKSKALSGRGNGSYEYRVRACNPLNNCGGYRSSSVKLKVLHKPGTPGTITIPVGVVQVNSYYISWGSASGSVAYYQYRKSTNNGASYGSWNSVGTSKKVTFKSTETSYQGTHKYQVRACNATGCSGARTSGSVQVYQVPGTPSSITVPSTAVGTGYTVTWGAGSGKVTYYRIKQEYNGSWGGYSSTGTTRSKTYTLAFGGKVRNLVQACNPAGCSSSRVSGYYKVKTNTICGTIPSYKSGFEMTGIAAIPTSINSFKISYSYMLDGLVESGPAANNPPTEFLIQQSDNGGAFYDIAKADINGFTVTGLKPGDYKYRVQGISSFTCASNILTTSTRTVYATPPTPSAFSSPKVISPTPKLKNCKANSYEVNWPDTPGANQYQLEVRSAFTAVSALSVNETVWSNWSAPDDAKSLTSSSYTHKNLIPGTNYQYRVKARYKLNNYNIYTTWSGERESGKYRLPYCTPDAPNRVSGDTDAQYPNSTNSSIITYLDRDGEFWMRWRYTNKDKEKLVGYYELQKYMTKISPPPGSDRLLDKAFLINELDGGIYRYDVVACNVDGCSDNSPYLEVTVALPAEPPSLPLPFDFVADPDIHAKATTYEGKLNGTLNVMPSGAATYSLPISKPAGTAGIEPNLSLEYSSQASNGLLGIGWSLGGLSMITRCPQTLAQDQQRGSVGYNEDDRFCLDGKRLVVVDGEYGAPGSVYRTEIDGFDIVTAKGTKGSGPAWFEVESKTGAVIEYGNTPKSQIEADGKESVAVWAMNRVEDTVSNYYTVDYYEGSGATVGEFYPTAFHYTGNTNEGINPYVTIDLVYETRPDQRVMYHRGSKTTRSKRLKKIVTPKGEYQLEYAAANDFQASYIEAVQYCDGNNNCPASKRLTFDWQENNGQEGWQNVLPEDNTVYQLVDEIGNSYYKTFVDIDGDGNVELISGKPSHYVNGGEPCIKNCDPNDPQYQTGTIPAELYVSSSLGVNGPGWEQYPGPKPAISPFLWKSFDDPNTAEKEQRTMDAGVRFVDLNRDGFVDILQGRGSALTAWLHGPKRGDGWSTSSDYKPPVAFVNGDGEDNGVRIIDLNGDGLPDILRAVSTKQNSTSASPFDSYKSWLNTGNGWKSHNGWAHSLNNYLIFPTRGGNVSVSITDSYPKGSDGGARFSDLNGDGLVDVLYLGGKVFESAVFLNTGYSFHNPTETPPAEFADIPGITGFELPPDLKFVDDEGRDQGLRLVDLNGDGLMDLMRAKTGTSNTVPYKSWLNTGEAWVDAAEYRAVMPLVQAFYEEHVDYGKRFIDVNGDGLIDILQRGATGTGRVVLNTGKGWNEVSDLAYRPKGAFVMPQGATPDNIYDVRNTGAQFADINSDGYLDFVSNKTNRNSAKPLLITGITDGLENTHTIHYKLLTDPEVYELEDNVNDVHLRDVRMAMYVVHQVDNPDGRDKPQSQAYFYKGLVLNTQGLGPLGFREITLTDLTTNFYSVTEYNQTYPFVGLPVKTVNYTDNGQEISEIHNTLFESIHTTPSGFGGEQPFVSTGNNLQTIASGEKINVPVFAYIKQSTETIYHLNNQLNPVGSQVVSTTTNDFNKYGNATNVITEVNDGQGNVWKTEILNEYGSSFGGGWHERKGLITKATVIKTMNNITDDNSERVTEFKYDSSSHLLIKETVEPGRAEPNTLVTVYDHDGFGNRKSVTVCAKQVGTCAVGSIGPADLPHRTTKTSFDPADYPNTHPYAPAADSVRGRYPVVTTNAQGHQVSYRYNHDFGVITEQTGPNGLSTCYEYDNWGRLIKDRKLCGTTVETQSITEYHVASSYTEHAAYTVSNYIAGREHGTTARTYFDTLGRELRKQKRGFKGQLIYVDHEYDERGRPRKVSEPYFYTTDYAPTIHWNESKVIDDLGRVQQILKPVGDISFDPQNGEQAGNPEPPVLLKTTYNGFETQNTDAKGHIKATYKNAIGQTTKTIDAYNTAIQSQITYRYNSQGNPLTTTDSGNNVIELGYDIHGRKVWMKDPDMGKHISADTQWTYIYNGYGELTKQIDALGQVTHISYDNLGRMIARTDLFGSADAQTSTWVYDTAPGAGKGKLHTETGQYASKEHIYDQHGRLVKTTQTLTTSIETGSFTTEWRYDELGRRTHVLYPEVDSNTPRVWMNYQYNAFGYLHYMLDITDDPAGVVYWRADEVNARGQIELEQHRNRTRTQQYHNEANGWMDATFTMDGTTEDMQVAVEDNLIQHTHYSYDVAGNVKTKTGRANGLDNFRTDLTEHYQYDELNRLSSSGISGYDADTGSPFGVGEKDNYPARTYQYDILGNITRKDGIGDYFYGSDCENGGAGPHAVCEIRSGNIVMKSYEYDANGNMTNSYIGSTAVGTSERVISYTSFNKPYQIIDNSRVNQTSAEFYYGADRSRVLRIADELKYDDQNNETTERERIAYIGHGAEGGAIMERKTNEVTEKVTYIHFMYAGGYHKGQAFAMRVIEQQNAATIYVGTEYYHRDHLGSVIAITDDTGLKRAYDESNNATGGAHAFLKGYDAWGKRRNPNWSEEPGGESQYTSVRGHLSYTGQEAITGAGLIHMNGRVYDPELGRFLSADPNIQSEGFSQSYNRYSYVWNNPVNATDPSGYFLRKLMQSISPGMAQVIGFALNFIPGCQGWCSAAFNAVYAHSNGASGFGIALSFMSGYVGGQIGHNAALGAGFQVGANGAFTTVGGAMFSGMISGAITGGILASVSGENARRGFFQGAIRGALMAGLSWGIQQSISNRTAPNCNTKKQYNEIMKKILEEYPELKGMTEKDYKITAVVHLDSEYMDRIGHAFIVLTDVDGSQIAYGFWPGEHIPKSIDPKVWGNMIKFLNGAEQPGWVRNESRLDDPDAGSGYLEDYNDWVKTGVDPSGGAFVHKEFDINAAQYFTALEAMSTWNDTYSINCMCGTYTQGIIQSTGNTIGGNTGWSTRPRSLFKELGGAFK